MAVLLHNKLHNYKKQTNESGRTLPFEAGKRNILEYMVASFLFCSLDCARSLAAAYKRHTRWAHKSCCLLVWHGMHASGRAATPLHINQKAARRRVWVLA